MIEVERPGDLAQYVGKEIGVSDWFTVDVERAKREMPGGKTIAHGYLTLSLVPRLAATIYRVKKRSRGLNYGSNRVRFTGQVPAGSRIRLRQKIKSVEPVAGGGVRITSESTVEVEGAERPALVAETISMQFELAVPEHGRGGGNGGSASQSTAVLRLYRPCRRDRAWPDRAFGPVPHGRRRRRMGADHPRPAGGAGGACTGGASAQPRSCLCRHPIRPLPQR